MTAARTCEETSPLTGQRCRAPAVVVVERYGATFGVCAACALLFQWQGKRIRGATREILRQNPARRFAGNQEGIEDK